MLTSLASRSVVGERSMPSRTEVATRWQDLISDGTTRVGVRRWADQCLERRRDTTGDLMLVRGLERLRAYALTAAPAASMAVHPNGTGEAFVYSDTRIAHQFTEWRLACESYDRDPSGE